MKEPRVYEVIKKAQKEVVMEEEEDTLLGQLADQALKDHLDGKTEPLDWRDLE